MASKDNGYIKLHRKLIDWQWWGHPAETLIFIYFLCIASYTPVVIDGHKYPAGTVEITLSQLEREFKCFSRQNIRTALTHLETSNEIRKKSTHQKSLITIVKWRKYQLSEKATNTQLTHNQHTTNTPPYKEIKNVRNNTLSKHTHAPAREEEKIAYGEYDNVFLTDDEYLDLMREFPPEDVKGCVNRLSRYKKQTGKTYDSDYAVIAEWLPQDFLKEVFGQV